MGYNVYILPVQSQCECKYKHSKNNIQLQNNIKHFLTFKIYLEDQYFYFSHSVIALDQRPTFLSVFKMSSV